MLALTGHIMRLIQPLNLTSVPTDLLNRSKPFKIIATKQTRLKPEVPFQPVSKLRSGGFRGNPSSSSTHPRKITKKTELLDHQKYPNLRKVIEALMESDNLFIKPKLIDISSNAFLVRMICIKKAIEIKSTFSLLHETLFLSIHLMDVYFQRFTQILESFESSELDYLRDLDELPSEFPQSEAAKEAEKIIISAVFMASKFQEIHPPRLNELVSQEVLSIAEFSLIEAAILKAVDFNIRPSAYISYIHILNNRVFGSSHISIRILQAIYVGLIGGFINPEHPVYTVMALGSLSLKKNNESSERAFNNFRIEHVLCSKKIIKTEIKFALSFQKFVGLYEKHKIQKLVTFATEGDQIFSNELQRKF